MQAVLECPQSASNRQQPHCLWLPPPHTVPDATRHSHSAPRITPKFSSYEAKSQTICIWPGIDHDINNIVLACKQCQDSLPFNPREPIIFKPKPSRPFQEVAGDFCSYTGHDYLILVDCYSDWPDVIPMGHDTTTPCLIAVLKQSFCRTGVPDTFWSNQGPQFTAKLFQYFVKTWGFQHITSLPTYPQSNGKIEATTKSMKKLI